MHVLRLHCDDRPGVVAAVATALSNNQCNIEESAQFNDHLSGQFFMRVVFTPLENGCLQGFQDRFKDVAGEYRMTWQICDLGVPVKTLILVSKHDHCLNDLLYRWRTGHLPIDITGVVSNHDDARKLVESHDLPFHHLPVTKDTKERQEENIAQIVQQTTSELIVLARYMQIISKDMCNKFSGRIINIHHSFLPGFKGARPYHQAYERGVKIIGATAHFATPDLDEGPIIEQETVRVDHSHTPEKMQNIGRDTENRVLARAIRSFSERRIFLHGQRTVIL
ncbi:MAG: formyltetrahydrofolate deformylase [Rhodospirillales bacterium]|nr:formyltetrahydrofolate deformylase [Alphaproteobacteria bacterium]USO03997.1 MAG: formyltetrahydrofolate deformylase [Rhodospirillales bacterium]